MLLLFTHDYYGAEHKSSNCRACIKISYNDFMILVGVTGAIGHGKSTFAEFLAEIEPKTKIFETGSNSS